MTEKRLNVLLEMRPAFDGHAGIPQETRLLFGGLCAIPEINAIGLIQSSGHVLAKALPADKVAAANLPAHKQLNRLSRVVISSKQGASNPHIAAVAMALRQLLGGTEELGRFDPHHFKDFIWRSMFARTLHSADFNAVTSAEYRVARVPWTAMHRCALVMRYFGYAMYPRLDTSDFDVMVAETPYPGTVSANTRLIVRYHDAIPLLMPHTISDREYHQASHYHALRRNVESGAHFACVSEATRRDLLAVFPEAESRSVTIHNMISEHYFDEASDGNRVAEIVKTRLNIHANNAISAQGSGKSAHDQPAIDDYLLIVSTIEPRKNHATLLAAWEHLRAINHLNLKLVVVGMLGWESESIVTRFRPWIERGNLFVLEDVPATELRLLYKHARVTVCPSFYEGFDFSGVEAMRCGGAVIASDIPVHREVYGDAAEFFSPYSTHDLVNALTHLIESTPEARQRRQALVERGAVLSEQYTSQVVLPQWQKYLESHRRFSTETKR